MSKPQAPTAARILWAVAIVLVAFNLRPAMSSIGPLLPEAMRATGLDPARSGLITTLPVFFLGLFGLTATTWSRRLGPERTVLLFVLVQAAGLALRALGTAPSLVIGCGIGGVAIGIVNVLMPGIVKREFPDQTANMMGLYTMALCAGAAIAAGASVPLANLLGGWSQSLAFWAVPALVAALVWLVQVGRSAEPPAAAADEPAGGGLWRDPLAWRITLFMGLQSALAYGIFAWLAPMLRDRGLSPVEAGLVVMGSILVQAPAALIAPALATRGQDQRAAVLIAVGLSLAGLVGLLFGPLWSRWLWVLVIGAGQGAVFALVLTIIVLRAGDARTAAKLSSMAQGVGYMVAAAGPLLIGLLRSWTGGWLAPELLLFAITAAVGLFGYGAGRNALVSPGPPRPFPVRMEASEPTKKGLSSEY